MSVVKQSLTTDADSPKTVAQPAVEPAEPGKPDMVLTGGKAGRVRKSDVIVVKHYLHAEEITQSNRIAAMFLDDAEDRASQRQDLRMDDWRQYVDRFVAFNERPLLKDAGTVSHERMQQIVHERYAVFDAKRRKAEALAADVEDIKALEPLEKLSRKGGDNASSRMAETPTRRYRTNYFRRNAGSLHAKLLGRHYPVVDHWRNTVQHHHRLHREDHRIWPKKFLRQVIPGRNATDGHVWPGQDPWSDSTIGD